MSKIITFPFEVTPITLISDRFLSGADLAKRLGVNLGTFVGSLGQKREKGFKSRLQRPFNRDFV